MVPLIEKIRKLKTDKTTWSSSNTKKCVFLCRMLNLGMWGRILYGRKGKTSVPKDSTCKNRFRYSSRTSLPKFLCNGVSNPPSPSPAFWSICLRSTAQVRAGCRRTCAAIVAPERGAGRGVGTAVYLTPRGVGCKSVTVNLECPFSAVSNPILCNTLLIDTIIRSSCIFFSRPSRLTPSCTAPYSTLTAFLFRKLSQHFGEVK